MLRVSPLCFDFDVLLARTLHVWCSSIVAHWKQHVKFMDVNSLLVTIYIHGEHGEHETKSSALKGVATNASTVQDWQMLGVMLSP